MPKKIIYNDVTNDFKTINIYRIAEEEYKDSVFFCSQIEECQLPQLVEIELTIEDVATLITDLQKLIA